MAIDLQRPTERDVKAANRRLYDAVAGRYEQIDGRRSASLESWLRGTLAQLRSQAPGGRLLDVGAGSGLVCRCAEGHFDLRVGIDLSPAILAAHRDCFTVAAAGDVDRLPFPDRSFDALVCFAALHHLFRVEGLIAEAARVLKPGGVFYSAHAMGQAFHRRFRLPLAVDRRRRNASGRYRAALREDPGSTYALAEFQEAGIDSVAIVRRMEAQGFRVELRHHWFGLTPLTDRLFGSRPPDRGWAPLAAIRAVRL